jgi:hypothetical protein
VAHDLAANLDQPVPERRQRPVPHGVLGELATGYRVLSIGGVGGVVNRIGPIPTNYTIG